MLKLAVTAQLPLIEVTTRDMLNFLDVVYHLTKKKPIHWSQPSGPATIKEGEIYWFSGSKCRELAYTDIYKKLVLVESSLLVVNPPQSHALTFKAGEVPVPRQLLLQFISAVVQDEQAAAALLPALGGCTIKEAAEVVRLTMARDKSLTSKGVMLTRKTCFQGGKGVTQVDPTMDLYEPPQQLQAWMALEGNFFLHGTDPRLIPRGLLMDGPPGTGKTQAAKWIAATLGVPLYRIDIGGVKNKFVGESEANMLQSLSQLDNEEPCVALFDEIEKVFGADGYDSGTTTSMLSQVLWWLAEHRSKVLVVMTTNNRRKLPPELYRPGRIDQVLMFEGLGLDAACQLAEHVLATFGTAGAHVEKSLLHKAIKTLVAQNRLETEVPTAAQSAITSVVIELVKSKPALNNVVILKTFT